MNQIEQATITWGVKSFFKKTPEWAKKAILSIGAVFAVIVGVVQVEPDIIPEPYKKDVAGICLISVLVLQAIGEDPKQCTENFEQTGKIEVHEEEPVQKKTSI